jgi:hypothetical protein
MTSLNNTLSGPGKLPSTLLSVRRDRVEIIVKIYSVLRVNCNIQCIYRHDFIPECII